MGEGERPEFWGWAEDVHEAFAIARANFGTIGDADDVCVSVHAVF